jgi:hypothetical protein
LEDSASDAVGNLSSLLQVLPEGLLQLLELVALLAEGDFALDIFEQMDLFVVYWLTQNLQS